MAYSSAGFIVVETFTNYDSTTQYFDTAAVDKVIGLVMEHNLNSIMVINGTILVGYTKGRVLHEKRLLEVFVCRIVCMVISSL